MKDSGVAMDWQAAACASRASQWEPTLRAWKSLLTGTMPGDGTLGDATLPFAGTGFAVKDIIDVAGFPTCFGSRVFESARAAQRDAPVVAALRAIGAICIGKTTSTEFALTDPTQTCNPYDVTRTPGGSSSGSGAVVGARIVPFALGTQTAGSLCRPAAFCGAYAYKATLDWWPMQGISPLSRSFDMVGPIAVSIDWLIAVHDAWARAFNRPRLADLAPPTSARRLRIGVLRSPDQAPSSMAQAARAEAGRRFSQAGHELVEVDAAVSFAQVIASHRQIMLAEAARDVLPLVGEHRPMLGPKLAEALSLGEQVSPMQYQQCIGAIAQHRQAFWSAVRGLDILLTLPAPGVAPVGLNSTGDQSFQTPWTALGGPLVNLPCGHDDSGMPLAIMLAAAPGRDAELLASARLLDPSLPETMPPALAGPPTPGRPQ